MRALAHTHIFPMHARMNFEGTCPLGRSWVAYPDDDDKAHYDYTECSNGGICERDTGTCVCFDAFFGGACQYMKSDEQDVACNGKGRHYECSTSGASVCPLHWTEITRQGAKDGVDVLHRNHSP